MKLEIKTYAELHALIAAWATARRIPLLTITSRPGLGKTEAARHTAASLSETGSPPLTLDTHVTPMQLYMDLFRHRDQPVILDDLTDRVLSNEISLSILKSLCDSREERRVEYNSSSQLLDNHDIPRTFVTRSPVLLLSNIFAVVSASQTALQSRAVHADFVPPINEVLSYIRGWAKDKELLDYFDRYRGEFPLFSARDYSVCEQLKESGLAWQDYAMRASDPVLAEVIRLQALYANDTARIAAFAGGRATYYRYKARIKPPGKIATLKDSSPKRAYKFTKRARLTGSGRPAMPRAGRPAKPATPF